ncbi:hypothetical protein L7F22_037156 [Adiantum nelumboides]|nr:hypothetical protein [Adiantum nelumboides]
MEVCSRQMTMTLWGQAAAAASHGETEVISSTSSSIHDIKPRGDSLYPSSITSVSTCKHHDRDRKYADGRDIVYMTDGNDDCAADVVDVAEDSRQQQELHDMQGNMECSMCGHVGLPQYLFKCLSCSYRYQHIYCSSLYPYRMEADICNWCLPTKAVIAVDQEELVDIVYNCNSKNSDIATKSDRKPQQVKHSKAFECLLQVIAGLADAKCDGLTNANNDYQTNPSCSDDDKNSKKLDVHHGIYSMQQNSMIQEGCFGGKSDIAAGTDEKAALGSKGALSHMRTLWKRPRCHVDDSRRPMKVTDCCDYDQVIRTSPDHRKTYERKMGNDQDLWLPNNPSIDHNGKEYVGIANSGQKGLLSKSSKQSVEAAKELNHCISKAKAANQQGPFTPGLQATATKMGSSDFVGDDDGKHEASALLCNKLMSRSPAGTTGTTAVALTSTTWGAVSNQSKSVTGKRDLTNSPSRAFNRRYKLLADVLC